MEADPLSLEMQPRSVDLLTSQSSEHSDGRDLRTIEVRFGDEGGAVLALIEQLETTLVLSCHSLLFDYHRTIIWR